MTAIAVPLTETSLDPRTGGPVLTLAIAGPIEVDRAVRAAALAADPVANTSPTDRAGWLEAIADAVLARADELAEVADRETGLGRVRLDGEVLRCAAQLRFYAAVARDGGFLDVVIDRAAQAQPDLRRMRVPLGPVAVFGASSFPFAFGSLGNDTASALAAGCPVVVKAHPAHLATHQLLVQIATGALVAAGAPEGTLSAVVGLSAGTELVMHPAVRAVAFTGSQQAGLALAGLSATRAVQVPVFAEMSTVNPVVVTVAAQARAATIGDGCATSFTMGMGQFCTKPGLVLAPRGSAVTAEIVASVQRHEPRGPLLTTAIAGAYAAGIDRLLFAGATMLTYVVEPGPGAAVSAAVLSADAELLQPGSPLLEECFGPVLVVVEYDDAAHRDSILGRLQGCLVATVMTDGPHDPELPGLVSELTGLAGRVVVDAWPTGVATTWAQHHGGPWPSTTAPAATSVGSGALDRFTRPVAYQGVVGAALPAPLRTENEWGLPRRLDGILTTADSAPATAVPAPARPRTRVTKSTGATGTAKRTRTAKAAGTTVTAKRAAAPRRSKNATTPASTAVGTTDSGAKDSP